MKNSGVYIILHIASGKVYVGSSKKITHRLYCHRWDLNKQKHHSLLLQRAWNKYGEGAFVFQVVENCKPEDCHVREQYYIDLHRASEPEFGYNREPNAGTSAGRTMTEETRKKVSEGKMGGVPWNKGLKGAQKWADNDPRWKNPPNLGNARSEEVKKKISDTKKARGQRVSKEAHAKSARVNKVSKKPQNSKTMKEKWADPEWRKMVITKQNEGKLAKKKKQC